MTPENTRSNGSNASSSGSSFGEQVILTVKVLLITGGALGLLALLEWIVAL